MPISFHFIRRFWAIGTSLVRKKAFRQLSSIFQIRDVQLPVRSGVRRDSSPLQLHSQFSPDWNRRIPENLHGNQTALHEKYSSSHWKIQPSHRSKPGTIRMRKNCTFFTSAKSLEITLEKPNFGFFYRL